MTRDILNVLTTQNENSQSISLTQIIKTTVNQANGIQIKSALKNKDNTLVIMIENTASSDSTVTFVKGNWYPNAILNNLTVPIKSQSILAVQLQDISRFENQDGSINIDFASNFTGFIYAVAKSTELVAAF